MSPGKSRITTPISTTRKRLVRPQWKRIIRGMFYLVPYMSNLEPPPCVLPAKGWPSGIVVTLPPPLLYGLAAPLPNVTDARQLFPWHPEILHPLKPPPCPPPSLRFSRERLGRSVLESSVGRRILSDYVSVRQRVRASERRDGYLVQTAYLLVLLGQCCGLSCVFVVQ